MTFNLSDKIEYTNPDQENDDFIWKTDVKQFIKDICKFIDDNDDGYVDYIKDKAGDDLIK